MGARIFYGFLPLYHWRWGHGRCTRKTEFAGGVKVPAPAEIMVKQTSVALNDAAEWLGDWHPLAEQLGSADGLLELGSVSAQLHLGPVKDLVSLRTFLRHYH